MLACEVLPLLAGGKALVAISYTVATTSLVVQNLRSFLVGQGLWNGTDAIDLTVTIPSGKSVWSNNKANAAIEVLAADFSEESIIRIVNAGLISGKGDWSPAGGALKATRPVIVDNTGAINGGGYNASGQAQRMCPGGNNDNDGDDACGCCRECYSPGSGGTGYGYSYSSAGSAATVGASSCAGCDCLTCCASGGSGGGPGNNGYCVSGNANITWIHTGTRNGAIT
jgi:hypothetical protein